MCKKGIAQQINRLLKVEKNNEIYMAGIRTIGEICKSSDERVIHFKYFNQTFICYLIDK